MAAITSTLSYVYGALLILGGAMGAAKGSTASLVAGGGSGLAAIALERAYAGGASASVVASLQSALAAVLAYVMGQRYGASGKFMPAGLVFALSTGMTLAYALRLVAAASGKPHSS
jgi:hypothetical protein